MLETMVVILAMFLSCFAQVVWVIGVNMAGEKKFGAANIAFAIAAGCILVRWVIDETVISVVGYRYFPLALDFWHFAVFIFSILGMIAMMAVAINSLAPDKATKKTDKNTTGGQEIALRVEGAMKV